MAASELQAGPMVQMIFARRGADRAEISGDESGRAVSEDFFSFLFFGLAFNYSSIRIVADVRRIV